MRRDRKQYHILVIEDNEGDFVMVDDLLAETILAPVITHAPNFKIAKEILGHGDADYDVILLDITLSDKSGKELIEETLQLASAMPVIVNVSFPVKPILFAVSPFLY